MKLIIKLFSVLLVIDLILSAKIKMNAGIQFYRENLKTKDYDLGEPGELEQVKVKVATKSGSGKNEDNY